jgi:ABC-type polysaccharide/polyol phosphate transport system ATPase subunit
VKEALHPLRKQYHRGFEALKNISFEINKGQTLGVIGKNGSGKSTLLKILTKVLTPSSGSVEVNGKVAALLELGAGFNPELTGIENIYFSGTLMGYTEKQIKERIPHILEFADIGEFSSQPVKLYSSGMFARLAFAVAINVSPDILIVDEALSVGDAAFSLKCLNKMNEIARAGSTIIFVSHDIQSVKTFCDQVLWMHEGRIQDFGESNKTCSAYLEYMYSNTLRTHEDEEGGLGCRTKLSRWGTGEVMVTDFHLHSGKVKDYIFNYNDEVEVKIEALSHVANREGRIGFSIKNEKALDIINWMSETLLFDKERTYKFDIFFKNILAPGKYFLILVVDDLPNGKYYDYVENAVLFEVVADKTIHSLVLPDMRVVFQS